MAHASGIRVDVHELSSRLALEDADVVPPGRVLAWTILAERRLRFVTLDAESRLELVEASVRRQLAHAAAAPGPRFRDIG